MTMIWLFSGLWLILLAFKSTSPFPAGFEVCEDILKDIHIDRDVENRFSVHGLHDYAKLNMAEFFFAEVAYYALPEGK